MYTLSCSKLVSLADSLTDEKQLLSSLTLNDTLSGAMTRYDELLASALAMRAARCRLNIVQVLG
jgi:lambda repressor-like predicted transcriptional regulator